MTKLNTNPLMRKHWWLAALFSFVVLALPFILVFGQSEQKADTPWKKVPEKKAHVDHKHLMPGPYTDGPSVTKACLECHAQSAKEVMGTTHWTWESDSVQVQGRDGKVTFGKKHGFNNFCIAISGGNWPSCTSCHAGYGWSDQNFDFKDSTKVDCLVCHEQTGGQYSKGSSGLVKENVDLVKAAQSVGRPKRENCGSCHFSGGGGNAVKHGDLDQSMMNPTERLDVHMGRIGLQCVDCHTTAHHQIQGRSMSVNVERKNRLSCTNCHANAPHKDERLDKHAQVVACQTCHIPQVALKTPTKTEWDWSEAGQNKAQDPHHYLKIKGSFLYEKKLTPEYAWYNGESDLYVKGDRIDTTKPFSINSPHGSIRDSSAKIHPFKVHRGKQIYDKIHGYLLPPKTAGEGGYWKDFDWDQAARLGAQNAGLDYSGEYGFAQTTMYWPLDHMVAVKEKALQCTDCHSVGGRLDWKALGYPGDPMITRNTRREVH